MKHVRDGAVIVTVEGVGTPDRCHVIQQAFVAHGSAQCGFCIPGFVVSTKALLDQNPHLTANGHTPGLPAATMPAAARATSQIVDAVMDAAAVLRGK